MKRALILTTFLALPFALRADAPNVYAIRGARIVTAAGAPLESGTVVIRRGVIDAVGISVAVPPDAAVIDGAGMTVYPGLIDLGNTRAADQPLPTPPQNMRTTAEVERWKRTQILKPQTRAADAVKVDDAELTKLASAGLTSVLALPSGDVISGQSALVNVVAPVDEPQIGNIVEPRRGLLVVKSPVALHVSFPDRPRVQANAYPESLMGVIAFVRQSFLDAQHYGVVHSDRGPAASAPSALRRASPELANSPDERRRERAALRTVEGPLSTPALLEYLDRLGIALEPGGRAEINLQAVEWIRDAAQRLRRGFILLIDYGHEARELYSATRAQGTLTTFSRHKSDLVEGAGPAWLQRPGEQDITAHVDFTSVRDAAEASGLTTIAFLDQTYFVLGLVSAEWNETALTDRGRALKTLLMPGGLGSTHKVMVLGKGVGTPALSGCSFGGRVT
jgi:Putative S-adenosyl-L-methionine-dependent methyltransferase